MTAGTSAIRSTSRVDRRYARPVDAGRLAVTVVLAAAPAAAAPGDAPLDQPDLDTASSFSAVVDGQILAVDRYTTSAPVLVLLATSMRLAPGVALAVSAPLGVSEDGAGIGNLTFGAQYARPVTCHATAGVGVALTTAAASTGSADAVAHALPREAFRYFDDGSVLQVHGDARWRRGPLTVQGQLGIEDYVMPAWRDQVLVRAALALTLAGRVARGTLEGTLLTDALDEEYDEGHDVVGAVTLGGRTPVGGGAIGVHVTYQRSYPLSIATGNQWQVGFDAAFPTRWW